MKRFLLLTSLLILAPLAASASLEELTPDSAALVLEIAPDAGAPVDLLFALDAIGWERPWQILGRLLALIDGDLNLGTQDDSESIWGDIIEGLSWDCPALADVVGDADLATLFGDTRLSLHLSPFNPIPHALALSRPTDPVGFAALQDALIDCYGGPQLLQDGVALNLLFDGGDLPIVVANLGDTFAASTDPNLLRWVVRQAGGANQRSMASAPLGQAMARLTPGGIGIAADLSAVAQLGALFGPLLPFELTPLIDEVTATLATIGVVGARLAWDDEGVRAEGVQQSPEAPPAPLLGALLRNDGRAPMPPLLPLGSTSIAGQYIDWRASVAAVDQLLAVIAAAFGEELTLALLIEELLGANLNTALLDWAGPGWTTVTLGPIGSDLSNWLFGAPTLISIPIAHRTAATGAAAELADLIAGAGFMGEELMAGAGSFDFFGMPSVGDGSNAIAGGSVVRSQASVAGVTFERIRIGANLDLGLAIIGDHLSIVSPFPQAAAVLSAAAAGATPGTNPAWADALRLWPNDARAVRLSDQRAELLSAAQTMGSLGQPLMMLLLTIANNSDLFAPDPWGDDWGDWDGNWWDDGEEWWFGPDRLSEPAWDDELWDIDLTTLPNAVTLQIGETIDARLDAETPHLPFNLVGLQPGSIVEIVMSTASFELDTYLYVIDAATGQLLFENDDAPDTLTSVIAFEVEAGRNLQVIASSWFGYGTGPFSLSASIREESDFAAYEGGEAMGDGGSDSWLESSSETELPTFAELLELSDNLEAALRLLAERSGFASSVTRTEGDATVTRMFWPLR